MKVFYPILTTCFVLFFITSTAQTKDSEIKPQKKVLVQFGVTLINSVTPPATASNPEIRIRQYKVGNYGNNSNKYWPLPGSQIGVTLSLEIPFYNNFHFFTSATFIKYGYGFSYEPVERFSTHLGLHNVKQYHLPLQLVYRLRLGESNSYFTPKIGGALTYYTENIKSYSSSDEGILMYDNAYNYLYTLDYSYSAESSSIKRLIPSLSGALAFKFVKPKIGDIDIGLSIIYNIKKPVNYTFNLVKYDDISNTLISDETEQINFTVKNTVLQFYITWYPKFLRVTKKM